MTIELRPGMTVRDNDPREPARFLVIHEIVGGKAVLRHPTLPGKTFETRVSVSRIHTDGKVRRGGWSLVL
jgi:hypothetical protein